MFKKIIGKIININDSLVLNKFYYCCTIIIHEIIIQDFQNLTFSVDYGCGKKIISLNK